LSLSADWHSAEFAGTHWIAHFVVVDKRCSARLDNDEAQRLFAKSLAAIPPGEPIKMAVHASHVRFFDED